MELVRLLDSGTWGSFICGAASQIPEAFGIVVDTSVGRWLLLKSWGGLSDTGSRGHCIPNRARGSSESGLYINLLAGNASRSFAAASPSRPSAPSDDDDEEEPKGKDS